MFNLDRSIKNYVWQIHPKKDDVLGRRAELEDHMFTVIEALVEDGMTENEAYAALVSRMGNPRDLAIESKKNDAWYRKVHEYFGSIGYGWRQVWLMGFSLLFIIAVLPELTAAFPFQVAVYMVPVIYLSWFDRKHSPLYRVFTKRYLY